MQIYTYFFLDRRDVVQEFEFDECASDSEARLRARELLSRRPERRAVEIWDSRQPIALLPSA